MKIKIYCDNNANIHSKREVTVDTDEDFCGWDSMSDEERHQAVFDWVMDSGWVETGWEEAE